MYSVFNSIQQYSTVFNSIQQYSTVFNSIQQYSTAFNSIQQYSTVFNSIQQHSTVFNSIQQYSVFNYVWVFRLLQISGSNDGITELTRTGHKCGKKSNKSYCKKKRNNEKKKKKKKKGKQMVVKQRASTTLPFSLHIFTCDLDVFFSPYVCVWGYVLIDVIIMGLHHFHGLKNSPCKLTQSIFGKTL